MRTNTNAMLLDSYFGLLSGLNKDNKIKLIAKLSNSIIEEESNKNDVVDKFFGAFESDKTPEDIIKEIRESRNFNRNIETL